VVSVWLLRLAAEVLDVDDHMRDDRESLERSISGRIVCAGRPKTALRDERRRTGRLCHAR
jgi:hypothetical protein